MAEAPPRHCGHCGQELSPEDQFCRNCGTPVQQPARGTTPETAVPEGPPPPSTQGAWQRHCTNCGQELSPNAKFCPNCGTPSQAPSRLPPPAPEARTEIWGPQLALSVVFLYVAAASAAKAMATANPNSNFGFRIGFGLGGPQ